MLGGATKKKDGEGDTKELHSEAEGECLWGREMLIYVDDRDSGEGSRGGEEEAMTMNQTEKWRREE